MPEEKNDLIPDRWADQNERAKRIWTLYNTQIVPQIIRNALAQKPPCTFKELFQVLSVARLRCECEKFEDDYLTVGDEVKSANVPIKDSFGIFQYGGTEEPALLYVDDANVESLIKHRLKPTILYNETGLSRIEGGETDFDTRLIHPQGDVLDRLDAVFQKLISTEDFSEFIKNGAELVYHLSNFPPITRGNASVTAWLINNIAAERFSVTHEINPQLYDWIAFFETPEQYTEFYSISATVEYLKTIPQLYAAHKEFFGSIPTQMMENLNEEKNILEREKTWNTIKEHITEALGYELRLMTDDITIEKGKIYLSKDSKHRFTYTMMLPSGKIVHDIPTRLIAPYYTDQQSFEKLDLITLRKEILKITSEAGHTSCDPIPLTDTQRKQLCTLRDSALPFRKPTATLKQFIDAIAGNMENHGTDEFLSKQLTKSNFSLARLKELLLFEADIHKHYLFYYDDPILKQQMEMNWPEIETLRRLDRRELSLLAGYFKVRSADLTPEETKLDDNTPPVIEKKLLAMGIAIPSDAFVYLNRLRGMSLASWNEVLKLSDENFSLFLPPRQTDSNVTQDLKKYLERAVWTGGVKLQDLIGLSMKDILKITSPEALEAYKQNNFTCSKSFLSTSQPGQPVVHQKFL